MQTTDTPLSMEDAAASLLEPIAAEEETETDEAPLNETEPDEVETEADASEAEDEKDGEEDESPDDEATDDETDEDDSEEEQPEQRYTVKVDGEERQVTLEELQRGFSGQAYIQKGMEANKTRERELAEQAQTLQQQNEYILSLYQQAQQTGFTPAPQKPDPELSRTDPIAYLEATADYETQMAAYQAEQKQVQYLQEQQEAQRVAAEKQHMAEQERLLLQEMPELSDPQKAEEFRGRIRAASDHYGYTTSELREIVKDVRSVKALADAQKWRDLQAGKQAAKAPREAPKSVTKPKAKSRDSGKAKRAQEMKQKARKSQSTEDWAATLLE